MLLLLKIHNGRPTALAKSRAKKKPRSARAEFYSALMRALTGKTGDDLGAAFTAVDKEKFISLMDTLSTRMAGSVGQASESGDSRTFEVIVRATAASKSVIHQPVLLDEALRSMRLLNSLGLMPTARTYMAGEEKILSFDAVVALHGAENPEQEGAVKQ